MFVDALLAGFTCGGPQEEKVERHREASASAGEDSEEVGL